MIPEPEEKQLVTQIPLLIKECLAQHWRNIIAIGLFHYLRQASGFEGRILKPAPGREHLRAVNRQDLHLVRVILCCPDDRPSLLESCLLYTSRCV